jgi:hypothetical protein
MLVYMVHDKRTGKIVHIHHVVDVAGRSCTCSKDDVLRALPGHIDPKTVGVASTELDQVPSGRHTAFGVDTKTGAVLRTLVRSPAKAGGRGARGAAKERK